MPLGPEDLRLPRSSPPAEGRKQEIRGKIPFNTAMSFILGIPGIAAQGAGRIMMRGRRNLEPDAELTSQDLAGCAIALVGTVLLIVGLGFAASAKGRKMAWGLMGLLSCIGLLVLYLLGKRCLHCGTPDSRTAEKCVQCGTPM